MAGSASDALTLIASVMAILLSVLLVVRFRLHPFLALLIAALGLGVVLEDPRTALDAVTKGFSDVLGGTGVVIALGLMLGALLNQLGAAATLAGAALRLSGARRARWGALVAGLVIGLPLFFETGVVLIIPIVVVASEAIARVGRAGRSSSPIALLISALAGLSIAHCLLPPHPGPMLAVTTLGAGVGKTMLYGLLVAIPVAIIAGPLFGAWIADKISVVHPPLPPANVAPARAPSLPVSVFLVVLPVALIALREVVQLGGWAAGRGWSVLDLAGTPPIALAIALLLGLPLLLRRAIDKQAEAERLWQNALAPAGTILLSIGAGGALKQTLIAVGVSDILGGYAAHSALSPLLLGWGLAVAIRLATGSATVATITASGIMAGAVAQTGVSAEWLVLAIGCGSVFLSHVSDPGFWLVKGYLGTSTGDTFKSWSAMETLISVLGIAFIMGLSRIL